MPDQISCDAELLPFRLLRAARTALFRITDPDRYRTILAVREAGKAADMLARYGGGTALRRSETAVYTHLQSALRGKASLSPRSPLPLAAHTFMAFKKVAKEVFAGSRKAPGQRTALEPLLQSSAVMLGCLERQLCAPSASAVRHYGDEFHRRLASLRDETRALRGRVLCAEENRRTHSDAAALTAFEGFLSAAAGTGYAVRRYALRRRTGRLL
jgi:hypothetical protein